MSMLAGGRSTAAAQGCATGALAALSRASLCPVAGAALGGWRAAQPGRRHLASVKLFGVSIGGKGKGAAAGADDDGAAGTAQASTTTKVFLDFCVADEIMVRRVIFDVGDLRRGGGVSGDGTPAGNRDALTAAARASPASSPAADAKAPPPPPPIDVDAATTLMQLCTGRFVAGGRKASLRGRPLASALPGVGIRGLVNVGGGGEGGGRGAAVGQGCAAPPTQGSIHLADHGPDGVEFVICTADAADPAEPTGGPDGLDESLDESLDAAALLPRSVAGRVVYGMGYLKQIEAMTLTGNLEHVSIANCGEWTPETTEPRPGEQSEGQSGKGLGITGYTMYE